MKIAFLSRPQSNKKGQTLIIVVLIFSAAMTALVLGAVSPLVRRIQVVRDVETSKKSFYLSESGLEDVVYRTVFKRTVAPTTELSLNGGSVGTVTTDPADNEKSIKGTADVNGYVRKVAADLLVGTPVTFAYGIQAGTGGLILSNNSGINGSVYSNGNINGSNGSFVSEDAFAAGSITGVAVSGESHPGAAPNGLPITPNQINRWKNEAADGGVTGSKTFSGTNNELGPIRIRGNLSLSNNAGLKINGSVWVTGNLMVSNNAEIRLASGYGSGDGVIIVDGTATLSNGAVLNGSGTGGSYIMIISTNSTSGAISIDNNAGGAIFYAADGMVSLRNGARVKQVTAKTITLSNNVVIDYEPDLFDTAFRSGSSGVYEIRSWKEVE